MTKPLPIPTRTELLTVLLAVAAGAVWWAWMGWDHEYYTDSTTGYAAGPYRAWQVIGCVITLLVLALVAYMRLDPVSVGIAMTVGFTVGFATSAVPGDETGLSMVGVMMVGTGMAIAATVLGGVVAIVRSARAQPPAPGIDVR